MDFAGRLRPNKFGSLFFLLLCLIGRVVTSEKWEGFRTGHGVETRRNGVDDAIPHLLHQLPLRRIKLSELELSNGPGRHVTSTVLVATGHGTGMEVGGTARKLPGTARLNTVVNTGTGTKSGWERHDTARHGHKRARHEA